jgi:ElaB/YqjD/DUF883 family membrane-anchored ribosome-binding protein
MTRDVKDQAQTATSPDLEQVLNDFASLRRDFAGLVDHVKSGAVNGAGDATDAMRNYLGLLGDKTRGVYDDLAAQGERSAKAIGRQVEERPLMSLLLAFGVGMLASRLLSR